MQSNSQSISDASFFHHSSFPFYLQDKSGPISFNRIFQPSIHQWTKDMSKYKRAGWWARVISSFSTHKQASWFRFSSSLDSQFQPIFIQLLHSVLPTQTAMARYTPREIHIPNLISAQDAKHNQNRSPTHSPAAFLSQQTSTDSSTPTRFPFTWPYIPADHQTSLLLYLQISFLTTGDSYGPWL